MKALKLLPVLIAVACQSLSVIAQPFPISITPIDVNNVNTSVSSSNDMFWDFSNPLFEVPKGGGKHTIYAGTMWMGGLDAGGNIHLAGQTYRQTGNDMWPGPIDTILDIASSPVLWDKSWKVSKAEIINHQLNYTNSGYVVPTNIADWPGFDPSLSRVLAPFADFNSNGIYDPQNGDYPYILGDESIYSIFNDYFPHSETGCSALGVEVHREVFAFDDPSNIPLNNTIFMRYYVKNFSSESYTNFRTGIWIDFDLGNATDDYVGTDVSLDMIYAYNGDSDDETAAGYGINPPAQGVYFLNQTLSGSMTYDNINGSPLGNPVNCNDYYNLLKSIWLDNQPLTYGDNGRNPSNPVTTYVYPGITDPNLYVPNGAWDESVAGNFPGDRRILGAIGPFNLPANGVITFDIGYTYSRATSGGPLASVAQLQADVAALRLLYDSGTLTGISDAPTAVNEVTLSPNPASEYFTVKSDDKNTFDLELFNMNGQLVHAKRNCRSEETISLRNYDKGIYMIRISGEKGIQHKKLVVQ